MTGFSFKQFHINHDRCAMKVSTDSILLGAWAKHNDPKRILDLGTGSALLALMLAQRYPQAQIEGVELDSKAFGQAIENVAQSPWARRIQLFQQDIHHFAQKCGQKFDLIVANPPYFMLGCDCRNSERNLARYTPEQGHLDWLLCAERCLTEQGKICFVLPFSAGEMLKSAAKTTALYCIEQLDIITKAGKSPQRMLLSFARQPQKLDGYSLIIYQHNHQYSADFIQLTQAFYLRF